jgi:intraflagellar transport protein 122
MILFFSRTVSLPSLSEQRSSLLHPAPPPFQLPTSRTAQVAKRAFSRVRDMRYLDLIHRIQEQQRVTGITESNDVLRARVFAYQGRVEEAAKLYVRANERRQAMEMYTDLRQFDKAKAVLDAKNEADTQFLMKRQAEWCKSENDPTLAIDILNAAGEELASINMMGENGMVQKLIDKARDTNNAETEILSRIVEWLKKLEQISLAAEVCEKMNDNKLLVDLYVSAKKWTEAFAIANRHPELLGDIYLPYANWLAENDRFVEAQEAYRMAGMESKAEQVLEILAHNAVIESRFADAGFYHYQLAQGCRQTLQATEVEEGMTVDPVVQAKCAEYQRKADLYSAYSAIFRYIEEPFTSLSSEALLHNARFLLVNMGEVWCEAPPVAVVIFCCRHS